MSLLREDLLEGRAVALAGDLPPAVAQALSALGSRVEILGQLKAEDGEVGGWAAARAPLDALVYGACRSFETGGSDALLQTLQRTWDAVREVAVGALIERSGPGKVVLVAPRPAAGPFAGAAVAALENLARTLSVEWARYRITAVTVVPGGARDEDELAELICFLCSAAGEYFSGCRLDFGADEGGS